MQVSASSWSLTSSSLLCLFLSLPSLAFPEEERGFVTGVVNSWKRYQCKWPFVSCLDRFEVGSLPRFFTHFRETTASTEMKREESTQILYWCCSDVCHVSFFPWREFGPVQVILPERLISVWPDSSSLPDTSSESGNRSPLFPVILSFIQ